MNKDYLIDFQPENAMTFQPLKTMIIFLQYGLLLTSFYLDVWIFPHITVAIGTLLIFLGLRPLKKANRYFQIAFYMSLVRIMMTIIMCMLNATSYQLNNLFEIIGIVIGYILFMTVYLALKNIMLDHQCANKVLIDYILLQILGFIGSLSFIPSWGIVIIYIIVFVRLWKNLDHMKQDIIHHKYQIQLSNIKIGNMQAAFIYGLIMILGIGGMFFTTIASQYKINNSNSPILIDKSNQQDNLLDKIEDIVHYNGMTIQYHYGIYDFDHDDYYDHIIEYEIIDAPTYTYMVKTRSASVDAKNLKTNIFYVDQFLGNGQKCYVQKEKMVSQTDEIMNNETKYQQNIVYVNPFDSHLKGAIHLKVSKEVQLGVWQFEIGIKNLFDFPYEEKIDKGMQLRFDFEKTKIIDYMIQDFHDETYKKR